MRTARADQRPRPGGGAARLGSGGRRLLPSAAQMLSSRQGGAGADPELAVDAGEVRLDGVHAHVQGRRDLLVGEPVRGEGGEPRLGGGQVTIGRSAPADPLELVTGRARPETRAERLATDCVAWKRPANRALTRNLVRRHLPRIGLCPPTWEPVGNPSTIYRADRFALAEPS